LGYFIQNNKDYVNLIYEECVNGLTKTRRRDAREPKTRPQTNTPGAERKNESLKKPGGKNKPLPYGRKPQPVIRQGRGRAQCAAALLVLLLKPTSQPYPNRGSDKSEFKRHAKLPSED
jgi:hypothetical protein